jgi:hypothetical protein
MAAHLRVYPATDDRDTPEESPSANVRIRLRDLLPVVALAQKLKFIWLNDFLDDEVLVTGDLYEVMQAFRSVRPSA